MGLHLTEEKSEVSYAKHDIVCYKVLCGEKDYWVTPSQYTKVPMECINGKKLFKPKETWIEDYLVDIIALDLEDVPPLFDGHVYDLYEGGIHTYKNLNDAKKTRRTGDKKYNHVFKCIIPKGAKYFEGPDDFMNPTYASSSIRFIKKVI